MLISGHVVRGQKNPLHFGVPLRLKQAREAAGLVRMAVEEGAGVSSGTVSYLENALAGVAPALETLERLARVLGVTPCWLAYGAEGPLPFLQKRPQAEYPVTAPQTMQHSKSEPFQCEDLPSRLLMARELRGLSRKALGRDSETSDTTVRQAETGEKLPNVATAEKLAGALKVAPCWLAYGRGQGPQGE